MSMSPDMKADTLATVERIVACHACGRVYHAPRLCRNPECAVSNFMLQRQRSALQIKAGHVLIGEGRAFVVIEANVLRGCLKDTEMLLRIRDDCGVTTASIVSVYQRLVVAHG